MSVALGSGKRSDSYGAATVSAWCIGAPVPVSGHVVCICTEVPFDLVLTEPASLRACVCTSRPPSVGAISTILAQTVSATY